MRPLPLSVTISAAIHIVAVAWVGASELGDREDTTTQQLAPIEIQVVARQPEPEPVPVQYLDEQQTKAIEKRVIEPAPVKKQPQRRATSAGTLSGTSLAVTTGSTGTGGFEPGTQTEPGQRSKYFDMRTGGRADLTLPQGNFDDLDNAPRGTGPIAGVPKSGQLESAAGGRHKSDQDVFVAKIDRDGRVKIRDAKNLSAELSWNPSKLLSGRFDVTDWLMRSTKNDPYSSRKLKFLDETRDERVEIGKEYKKRQLAQTTMIIRKNLERAWSSSTDFAERKRALFELWDEIVEPVGDDAYDEILLEASRAARKAVIGFIRAHLPAGSEHAYSETELVAMNGSRQSKARFVPYD